MRGDTGDWLVRVCRDGGKVDGEVARRYGGRVAGCARYLFPGPGNAGVGRSLALKALGMPLPRRAESAFIWRRRRWRENWRSPRRRILVGVKIYGCWRLRGIGRWTANYFALRGWQARYLLPDDYLIKQRFAGMTAAQIATRSAGNRGVPTRYYAIWAYPRLATVNG